MNYIYECLTYIEANLNEHRKNHTFGVRDTAVRLAEIYGADPAKAEAAALFHDIAKPLSQEESDEQVRYYGLPDELLGNRNLAHGKIAACWARDRFGVTDEEILDAVSCHTTAKKNIPLLSKIIFVADTVEPGRTYAEAEMLRNRSYTDLDGVYRYILLWMKDDLKNKGVFPGKDTLEAIMEVTDEQ